MFPPSSPGAARAAGALQWGCLTLPVVRNTREMSQSFEIRRRQMARAAGVPGAGLQAVGCHSLPGTRSRFLPRSSPQCFGSNCKPAVNQAWGWLGPAAPGLQGLLCLNKLRRREVGAMSPAPGALPTVRTPHRLSSQRPSPRCLLLDMATRFRSGCPRAHLGRAHGPGDHDSKVMEHQLPPHLGPGDHDSEVMDHQLPPHLGPGDHNSEVMEHQLPPHLGPGDHDSEVMEHQLPLI